MFEKFLASIILFQLFAVDLTVKAQRLKIAGDSNFFSDSVYFEWVRHYISGHSPAFDFAIAVDAAGNVHMAGSSYGSSQLPDCETIKYTSSGDMLWVRRYNDPGV